MAREVKAGQIKTGPRDQSSNAYAPIKASTSTGASIYTVAQGDTLQSIAKTVYGDSQQWYRIAQANGLTGSQDLQLGQALRIPALASGAHNNSTTFKPYDPSKVIGDTTPTMPMPKHGGCGALGTILMIVVAVVVTIYTAGAAATAWSSVAAEAASAGASTMSIGASALAGSYGAAGAAAAVVGGAVGSIASQAIGMATGDVRSFSWKSVALSAIGAGITAGLGPVNPALKGVERVAAYAGRAALVNAATQGVGVITGMQSNFNWKSVAASAVGAGVGQAVGGQLGLNDPKLVQAMGPGELFGKQLATGLVAGAATAVARGGRVAIQQIATDAFGNAIGDSLVRASITGGASAKSTAYDDTWRDENLQRAMTLAKQPTTQDYYVLPNQVVPTLGGMTVLPVEVAQAGATSGNGYLPSMYPDPQIVESGINAQGNRYYRYDDGAISTAVPDRRPLDDTSMSPMPINQAEESARASDQRYYNNEIANATNPFSAIGYTYLRALNNAGHDIADGVKGIYTLATDANARAQLIYNGVNAIAHPIDTATGLYNAGAKYVSNTSYGQMAEDGLRVLAGGLATAGVGKGAVVIGEAAGDVAVATGRWLAPKAGEMAESFLYRLSGLTYAVEPGMSGVGGVVNAAESTVVRNGSRLLPGEGLVGTYDDLIAAGVKGDNLTPHHIPSANRMALEGVLEGDGIAISMEQPFPGFGGRHRATFTYGTQADIAMTPRDALGAGVWDTRRIYRAEGLYTPQIRSSLQELIQMNKMTYPSIFGK